jgi:hypothetical protein
MVEKYNMKAIAGLEVWKPDVLLTDMDYRNAASAKSQTEITLHFSCIF